MAKNLTMMPLAPFKEPWDHSFADRFSKLVARQKRVAYFYDQFDNSTFRYRVYNPCQTLNGVDGEWGGSFFFLSESDQFDLIVGQADLIIVCRAKYSLQYAALVAIARAKGKKLIYDVDDLVFDLDLAHFIANNNAYDLSDPRSIDGWFAYVGRISAALRMCDGAITTNQFLANEIKQRTGISALVMKNYLNQEQLAYSEQVLEHKSQEREDGKFKIGYFSGSPSHEHDFLVARSALSELMHAHPRVELVLVGYIARMAVEPAFKHRVTVIGFHDYVNLQRVIASVDLNIAPLQHNIFTNCKSELKLFEASIVETLTLATPTHTFSAAIEDGVDGYLATDMEWFEKMNRILSASPDDLQKIARKSKSKCLKNYGWSSMHPEITSIIEASLESFA